MTFYEVQRLFPGVKRDTARFILWELTAFPCAGWPHVEGQLSALAAKVRPHKRGWVRRLGVEARRVYAEMDRLSLTSGAP